MYCVLSYAVLGGPNYPESLIFICPHVQGQIFYQLYLKIPPLPWVTPLDHKFFNTNNFNLARSLFVKGTVPTNLVLINPYLY